MSDNDLPLLSNIDDIRARHYHISLQPCFDRKIFYGEVVIFFEVTSPCEKRGMSCTRQCFCESDRRNEKKKQCFLNSEKQREQGNKCFVEGKEATENEQRCFYGNEKWSESRKQCFCGIGRGNTKGKECFYGNNKGNGQKNQSVRESDMGSDGEILSNEVIIEKSHITSTKTEGSSDFELILDCCDIKVNHVREVVCSEEEISEYLDPYYTRKDFHDISLWANKQQLPLEFSVSQWCVKITKPNVKCVKEFPKVVAITYETLPKGKSVLWQNDQDGNPCVFTPGTAINNRSLLPYQDPPSAMATWQASITVPKGYHVSMTGDELDKKYSLFVEDIKGLPKNRIIPEDNGSSKQVNIEFPGSSEDAQLQSRICFYYYTSMVLPIATIAIAIGKWIVDTPDLQKVPLKDSKTEISEINDGRNLQKCQHYVYPCHIQESWNSNTQITVVCAPSVCNAVRSICDFLPHALKASINLLGTYPCHRIEVVILPRAFSSLGLASPNLIFLSPTLAINDSAAFIRISHEVSHAWFGINIGAKDWTEEWISEGFATYMEDLIFTEAVIEYHKTQSARLKNTLNENAPKTVWKEMTCSQHEELSDLRAHLRYRTLTSELENSNEDLQRLRPMEGQSLVADGVSFVKDGLNPEKTFLQVHYLKGYFFLKFLRKIVGGDRLDKAIKSYVGHYHGQLLLSQDILNYLMKLCPEISEKGITLEYLLQNWLHQPGLNKEISEDYSTISNGLTSTVHKHYHFWECSNKRHLQGSCKRPNCELDPIVFPDQLVLLFEYLLELPKLQTRIMNYIFDYYEIDKQNADVRHRWCELAIKHDFHNLSEIERFLTDDQSMGVYLYGELIISRRPQHRKLAKKIFASNENYMDENTRITVQAMLYGD